MTVAEFKVQETPQETAIFRHIVMATDFSKPSQDALAEALRLAEENNAELSVVHVQRADWRYEMVESPPEIDLERIDAQGRLKNLIANQKPGYKINTTLIKHGPVAQAVRLLAAEKEADLIVIGTHGRGGLSKLALGSVAEELLRIAPCPVMTVGPKAHGGDPKRPLGFHTILFATDFGEGSAKALPLALRMAKADDAKLILLHMISPMPATSSSLSAYAPATAAADEVKEWEESSRKRALRELKDCLPPGIGFKQQPEFVVGTDFFPEGVLAATEKFKADLIVMGASGKGVARMAAHLPWSAVHEVVRHAPCPVLTMAG
jgi:nucleotide-binding universal stress UspA family protein